MMQKRSGWSILLLFGLVILFPGSGMTFDEGIGIRAGGGVTIYPVLEIKEKYDDNIFESDSIKVTSWITEISPSIELVSEKGNNRYIADYRFSKAVYHSSRDDDYADHFVGFSAYNELSSRIRLDLSIDYDKMHDDRGSTFTGARLANRDLPDKYHEYLLGGELTYGANKAKGRVEVEVEYRNKRYDNNRSVTLSRDLDRLRGRAAFFYRAMQKTSVFVEAEYEKLDYKLFTATSNRDSNEQFYYLGLEWDATAKLSGSIRTGYQSKTFSGGGISDYSGFSWNMNITWSPKTYSTVAIQSSNLPEENDGAAESFTKSIFGRLLWSHKWSEYVRHSISGEFRRDIYVNDPQNRRDLDYKAGIRLDYLLYKRLTTSIAYDFSRRSSNIANTSFKRNILSLILAGAL